MANTTKNEILIQYWDKSVSTLATRPVNKISEPQQERHRLYALLAMAATHYFWNGDKRGKNGRYPMNVPVTANSSKYMKGDYLGHNILALAVDFDGHVIDFEMNHNLIYNSSAEHAEARLIKRIFSLASLADTWKFEVSGHDQNDYNTFRDVSIYTTLESCSQCSGVMALAQVKEVIYLQTDNGMYLIGNILRNLTQGTKLQAPNPIDGTEISLPYFSQLNEAFDAFCKTVSESNPFFIPANPNEKVDASKSVTSFLCTESAYRIFEAAKEELGNYLSGKTPLRFPDYQPSRSVINLHGKSITTESTMTNKAVIKEIASFYSYIQINGRRATPHR